MPTSSRLHHGRICNPPLRSDLNAIPFVPPRRTMGAEAFFKMTQVQGQTYANLVSQDAVLRNTGLRACGSVRNTGVTHPPSLVSRLPPGESRWTGGPLFSSSQAAYHSLRHVCQSSLTPLLLLSQSNPLRWASIGAHVYVLKEGNRNPLFGCSFGSFSVNTEKDLSEGF